MAAYEGGNTVRFNATFRDWVDPDSTTPGDIIDPSDVVVTFYDSDQNIIGDDTPVKDSPGVYHYHWTLPRDAGIYFIEFKGMVGGEPMLSRQKVSVKFDTT